MQASRCDCTVRAAGLACAGAPYLPPEASSALPNPLVGVAACTGATPATHLPPPRTHFLTFSCRKIRPPPPPPRPTSQPARAPVQINATGLIRPPCWRAVGGASYRPTARTARKCLSPHPSQAGAARAPSFCSCAAARGAAPPHLQASDCVQLCAVAAGGHALPPRATTPHRTACCIACPATAARLTCDG